MSCLVTDELQAYHHASDPESLGRVHFTQVTECFCSTTASNTFLILPFTILNQASTD